MKGKIIEATSLVNWGKFLVMRPDVEWRRRSVVNRFAASLLGEIGWGPGDFIVYDLQTNEGATFRQGGLAKADLDRHRIRVCVLFERFLGWLYEQDLTDLEQLPDHVDFPEVAGALFGYRRSGVV